MRSKSRSATRERAALELAGHDGRADDVDEPDRVGHPVDGEIRSKTCPCPLDVQPEDHVDGQTDTLEREKRVALREPVLGVGDARRRAAVRRRRR